MEIILWWFYIGVGFRKSEFA
jgi:sodium-dependent dicarboxylate transporter 2/3/5